VIVLGLDVETTGLSADKDRITELGMVLYDTERKQPIKMYSEYVKIEGEVSALITELTGITNGDLQTYGLPIEKVLADYIDFANDAEYIVAHNAPFDRGFLVSEFSREYAQDKIPSNPWLDTSCDVDYPEGIKTRKLEFLAASHGFINPWSHRAIFDVLTMLKVLDNYDVEQVTKLAAEEKVTLVAVCMKPWLDKAEDGKKETDIARSLGFRWSGGKKSWLKEVRSSQVKAEQSNSKIMVRVLV